MLNHDAAEDHRASCVDDPIDAMEPDAERDETLEQASARIEQETYREAGLKMIVFMHAALNYIHEARTPSEMAIRLWAVSSAVDHPRCDGRSDSDMAAGLQTTRANFSKHKIAFERQTSLPPTSSQKSIAARQSYRETRKSQLNGSRH